MRRFYSMERRFKTAKSGELTVALGLFESPHAAVSRTGRATHRLDDPLLSRFVQVSMHRQADDIARKLFAHRKSAVRNGEIPIRGLLMHGFRIVDRGRDALRL